MSNTSVRKHLQLICILASCLSANLALADWSGKPSQTRYNNQFGDFPPEDIDQHIQNSLDQYGASSESPTTERTDDTRHNKPEPVQSQSSQVPYNGYYDQRGGYNPRAGTYRNQPRTNFGGPWGNNSGFSGPWNNGSSFSGPWDNNGSNFSMPWGNNNGSGFDMPWGNNNNGSNFNMPWGTRSNR